MKKHELAYLKELAAENAGLRLMLRGCHDEKEILERRVVEVLKHNLKYYGESLDALLNGPGFPINELIDIFDIDVGEVEEAIEQRKKEAKEVNNGEN